jgi:hypothetical protein
MTLNSIYTPRIIAAKMRKASSKRSKAPEPTPANGSQPEPAQPARSGIPDVVYDPRLFVQSPDGYTQ